MEIKMKDLITKINLDRRFTRLERIEFFLSSFLLFTVLMIIIGEGPSAEGSLAGIYYVYHILLALVFYLSFLLINFVVIPNFRRREMVLPNLIIIAGVITGSFLIFRSFDNNILLIFLSCYFFLKFLLIFLLRGIRTFRKERGSFSTGILLAGIFYLVFMLLMIIGDARRFAIVIPAILIPYSIAFYSFAFHSLIPSSRTKKRPLLILLWKVFLILLVSAIPLGLLNFVFTGDEELSSVIPVLNFPIQILISLPMAWLTYRRYHKNKEQVQTLQKELGHSTAKFDFLRSQINPHFLFNALNTIYGTAIQEKAERTGEGVQKLGDMMRFMLHENMQEKISLEREIEYLQNYISLQKLRTDPSPQIRIEEDIQKHVGNCQISPMLLIPFVENAFKHGISFREPSHIKIALEVRQEVLNFDVYNSKHPGRDKDPEKDHGGIGLNNVKQRLELLYPKKHDLVIRESTREYFVHLSLQLNSKT